MAQGIELRGIGVVNATPLTPSGDLDEEEYRRHIRWLIAHGVGFLQPHAATGQGALSSEDEYRSLLEITVAEARGKALVTAYSGRASTSETIKATQTAKDAGADAVFVIQPWYSRPEMRGLYMHFKTVADAVDIPIVIYNNPNRTGLSIPVDLIRRLTDACPNIVGLKQTDLAAVIDSYGTLRHRISVSPYGDAEILWGLAQGATWSVSYAANVIPAQMVQIFEAWRTGDQERARTLFYAYLPLIRATHYEPLPAAIKYMLNRMGWTFGAPRLPVAEVSAETARKIDSVLAQTGLLERVASPAT